MKKIVFVLLIISCIVLSSCIGGGYPDEIDPHSIGRLGDEYDRRIADQLLPILLKGLTEKDIRIIKEQFASYVIENERFLDSDLKKVVNAIDGEIISYSIDQPQYITKSISYGKCTHREIVFGFDPLITNTGKEYKVLCGYVVVDDNNPSRVGFTDISIVDPYGEKYYLAQAGATDKH